MFVIRLIASALIFLGLSLWIQPVLSLGFFGFWATLLTALIPFAIPADEDEASGRIGIAVLVAVAFVLTTWISSAALFHASRYEAQLGQDIPGDFTAALPPIDIRQAPLVSEDMAHRSAEKQLANEPALGSQVTLGRFQKQLINGKLYWVAFLQHSGLSKWWNTGTTPGYVRVSATDATDVALVTQVAGVPLRLRYLPSGYFGDDLRRHLYFHGYASRGIADIVPEVDETGRPFYVVTFRRNTIGFSGAEADGVAIVDPQTGAITPYAMDQVPAWADILETPTMVEDQVANRAEYVHGWWNPSDADKLAITGTPDLVYGADHRAYWYVGLTSSGADQGLVGFYLVDSRTKAAHRFVLSGATEDIAAKAAEGVIPEKHYTATNPLPFVVSGHPTYVFALRDESGIARAFAMVNIQTFQTLAVGETLQATLRQYEAALSRDPSTARIEGKVTSQTRTAAIIRIGAVIHQGSSTYVLTLQGLDGKVLIANADLSDALPLARDGDTVTVSYEEGTGTGHALNLTSFSDPQVVPADPLAK